MFMLRVSNGLPTFLAFGFLPNGNVWAHWEGFFRVITGPCADAMALEQHCSAFGKQRDLCL